MKRYTPILLAVLLLVMGCTQGRVWVTYNSDPQYASVFENDTGRNHTCPATLSYTVDEEDRQRGYVYVKGFTCRWVSGAEERVGPIRVTINGTHQQFTFRRPPDVPYAHIDELYEVQKERNRLEAEQIRLMKEEAHRQKLRRWEEEYKERSKD